MATKLTVKRLRTKGGHCDRCDKWLPKGSRLLEESILFTNDGMPGTLVCGACLTVEEIADAVIREVTHEVGVTRDGRIMTRPKVSLFYERD